MLRNLIICHTHRNDTVTANLKLATVCVGYIKQFMARMKSELFLPLFDTKANWVVFLASRKRHSKTASSETSGGGPEEGELVPTKKKSRRTRESKEPKNENTEPREEGQRTPTP